MLKSMIEAAPQFKLNDLLWRRFKLAGKHALPAHANARTLRSGRTHFSAWHCLE
jgi:hypothetical protein